MNTATAFHNLHAILTTKKSDFQNGIQYIVSSVQVAELGNTIMEYRNCLKVKLLCNYVACCLHFPLDSVATLHIYSAHEDPKLAMRFLHFF